MRFTAIRLPYFAPEGETPPAGTPPAGTPPPAPTGQETWYGKAGIAAEHHEWLGAKQFADPNLLIASHRSLESLVGRQRLAVPNNAEDTEAYNAIYKTLGRPETHDKYALPKDSKISGDEWKNFSELFHKAGVSQAGVEMILSGYEKRAGDLAAAAEVERGNEEKRQTEALQKEWGSAFEANSDIAARAFRALGIDEATSDKIEAAIGYSATMKLFHSIGGGMSEARMLQDGGKGGAQNMGGTLESEHNKLNDKFADKDFMARYLNQDPRVRKDAIDEIEAIQKRIAELSK